MALHSAIYFLQFTTLNVAFISSSTTLLTVLVSNNFVELKGSIFKKCGPENLFQLCGGDIVTTPPPPPSSNPRPNQISEFPRLQPHRPLSFCDNFPQVERFNGVVFFSLATLQHLQNEQWVASSAWLWRWCELGSLFFVSEFVVDWTKHAFISKFNDIQPQLYTKFSNAMYATPPFFQCIFVTFGQVQRPHAQPHRVLHWRAGGPHAGGEQEDRFYASASRLRLCPPCVYRRSGFILVQFTQRRTHAAAFARRGHPPCFCRMHTAEAVGMHSFTRPRLHQPHVAAASGRGRRQRSGTIQFRQAHCVLKRKKFTEVCTISAVQLAPSCAGV